MGEHMAPATWLRQPEFVHDMALDRLRRIGFTKVLRILLLGNLFLKVPVLIGQHLPASKAFDRDNHGISQYNTSCLCQFLHSSFKNILNL